jgi:hypothetical protein
MSSLEKNVLSACAEVEITAAFGSRANPYSVLPGMKNDDPFSYAPTEVQLSVDAT